MKIATFNVNGISARLSALLRWLAESRPDVACLQELKAPQEKFPEAAIREAGYGVIWDGQKSWNGVAILARGPFIRDAGLRIDHLLLSPVYGRTSGQRMGRSRSPRLGKSERPRAHLDRDRGGSTISMRRSLVQIARREGLPQRYVTRPARLAFVSPVRRRSSRRGACTGWDKLQMLVDGRLALPPDWKDQQLML